jgi:Domain of unknown function (DUF4411)
LSTPSSSRLHLIDTCVLVNVRDIHKDSKKVWDAVISEIEGDRLKSVRQVMDELERRFPEVHKKLKPHKKRLLIPDGDLYTLDVIAEMREIQRHHPRLINPLNGGNPADPFLIAAAKSHMAVVVTDERANGPKHKDRIPFVCTNRNVGWISGDGYFKTLGCI